MPINNNKQASEPTKVIVVYDYFMQHHHLLSSLHIRTCQYFVDYQYIVVKTAYNDDQVIIIARNI